jgi:glycosyltransferase involved in cell wall biosynthesis
MAHGKPIVGCIGEGPEVYCRDGEHGFLVPPGDHAAVAEAWRKLLSADFRRGLGHAGRARAFKEFTWEKSAKRMDAVLTQLVGATGSGVNRGAAS